jgi:hypothetical protein
LQNVESINEFSSVQEKGKLGLKRNGNRRLPSECDVKILDGRKLLQVLNTGMKRERSESRNTSRPIVCTRRTQLMNTLVCRRECWQDRSNCRFLFHGAAPNKTTHQTQTIAHSRMTLGRNMYAPKDLLLHHFYIYARAGRPPPRLNGLFSCACEAVTATTLTGNDSNYHQPTSKAKGEKYAKRTQHVLSIVIDLKTVFQASGIDSRDFRRILIYL